MDNNWELVVHDVGDANFNQIRKLGLKQQFEKNTKLTIDFGFCCNSRFFKILNSECDSFNLYSEKLLISHYHEDHFNGIFKYLEPRSTVIEKLFFPYIPDFVESIKLQQFIGFYQASILSIHNKKFYNLIDYINSINNDCENDKQKNVDVEYLHQGMYVDISTSCNKSENFDVVWPPKEIQEGDNLLKKLSNKLKNLEDIIEDNESLRYEFEKFKKTKEDEYVNSCFISEVDDKTLKDFYSAIKGIANDISVCLYKENEFLFLGDLESVEIKNCIDYIKKKYNKGKINVKFFIAPHHGTHWNDAIKDVIADHVIISNGTKMKEYFKKEYEVNFASKVHRTFNDETFEEHFDKFFK